MRVLIVGGGARESALAWKLRQSKKLQKLFLWPGNPGMNLYGEPLNLPKDAAWSDLKQVLEQIAVDLIVVGPEQPLADGIADYFANSVAVFGPTAAAARIESSKKFAKEVMQAAQIPTAGFALAQTRDRCEELARARLEKSGRVVLKADGLAAGKGVFVCQSQQQVIEACQRLYGKTMLAAAQTVVVEECLIGRECSYFTMLGSDGSTPLGFAVDFKRLADGDQGPNTGGMGGYAPVPWLPPEAGDLVEGKIVAPLLQEFKSRNINYCGWLYVGLMWTETGPKVVEFNARLGDPEAQLLAVLDDRDWLGMISAKVGQEPSLAAAFPHQANDKAVAIVLAADGYPYDKPTASRQLARDEFIGNNDSATQVFAASLQSQGDSFVTGSGRVLTIVARQKDFQQARTTAYDRVQSIVSQWPECQWRSDIGALVAQESIGGQ